MHVHLPKPLHGWRAFFGEVGIIVLGVIVALGFEQVATAIHEATIAAEARDAVRAEVRENLWWLAVRERREPCIRRRLAELGDVLARARRGESTPVIQYLGTLPHAKITTQRWEANAQAGRASLFSGVEQRMLANIYYTTDQFYDAQRQEEIVWSKMRFIQGLDRFTPADVHDFSIFLAEARYHNSHMLLSLWRAHQWAQRVQLTPANPGAEGESTAADDKLAQICQPLTAPLKLNRYISGPDAYELPQDVP